MVPEAEEALKWAAAKGVAAPSVAALLAQPEHAAALAQEIHTLTLTLTLALTLALWRLHDEHEAGEGARG